MLETLCSNILAAGSGICTRWSPRA